MIVNIYLKENKNIFYYYVDKNDKKNKTKLM